LIELIFIVLCADWSAWGFQEEAKTGVDNNDILKI